MLYLIALLVILLAFGAGFFCGRRMGKRQGIDEGVLFAPLEIRRQCLEDGWCHICGHRVTGERKLTHS